MFISKFRFIRHLHRTSDYVNKFKQVSLNHTSVRPLPPTTTGLKVEGKQIRFNKEKYTYPESSCNSEIELERLYSDPDVFGTLSKFQSAVDEPLDKDEEKEEKFISERPTIAQILTTKGYADLIKTHLIHHRIKEALDVLEIRMLKEDRVKPENYIYNLLISACAKVGYTKKAFMLFNDMKRRGVKPKVGTYCSLFNACANSPWPATDGLARARGLRALMVDKAVEPNTGIYNAMIKAFGRADDLVTCFQIVDEMIQKKIKIRNHTFGFLLQSCISDKQSGFRHGLIVWKKMLQKKQKPNIYNFNLLLKCVKDCGLGDEKSVEEMLKYIYEGTVMLLSNNSDSSHRDSASDVTSLPENNGTALDKDLQVFQDSDSTNVPKIVCIKSFCELSTPQDRFCLFGGINGFLKEMKKFSVEPDVKTFTLLLDVIPNTLEAEKQLLENLKEHPKLFTDIDFYNMLIKRRCYRYDYEAAKNWRALIDEENKRRKKKIFWNKHLKLRPDIFTYGVLALTCKTFDEGQEFLKEMEEKRTRCNIEIMGTLLKHALVADDIVYVQNILDRVKSDEIRPNKLFLERLEVYAKKCRAFIKNKHVNNSEASDMEKRKDFLISYTKWLKDLNLDEMPENNHPWKQFRELQPVPFQKPKPEKIIKSYYKSVRRRNVTYKA